MLLITPVGLGLPVSGFDRIRKDGLLFLLCIPYSFLIQLEENRAGILWILKVYLQLKLVNKVLILLLRGVTLGRYFGLVSNNPPTINVQLLRSPGHKISQSIV